MLSESQWGRFVTMRSDRTIRLLRERISLGRRIPSSWDPTASILAPYRTSEFLTDLCRETLPYKYPDVLVQQNDVCPSIYFLLTALPLSRDTRHDYDGYHTPEFAIAHGALDGRRAAECVHEDPAKATGAFPNP